MIKKTERIFRIAQFGGFDLPSLGDTMFPVVFRLEMERRFGSKVEIDLYSPHGTKHPYNNLPEVYAIGTLEEHHRKSPYDCMVIGGGEFIHFLPIEYTSMDGEKTAYCGGELWQNPQKVAEKLGIPVVWNCVGVARNIVDEQEIATIQDICKGLAYISVRDSYSKQRLEIMAGVKGVHEVPDMLWLFNRHFGREDLENKVRRLKQNYNFLKKEYLVLQYGTSYDYINLAENVQKIAKDYGVEVVLLTINYCHEDQEVLEKIQEKYPEFHVINEVLQPLEIMAVIAGAKFFLGTSLHGNLAAMSYGVKSLCLDMYPSFVSKMDGLFAMLEKDELVVRNIATMRNQFDYLAQQDFTEEILTKIKEFQVTLDTHFNRIAELVSGEKTEKYEIEKKEGNEKRLIKALMSNGFESVSCVCLEEPKSVKMVFELKEASEQLQGVIYNDKPFKLLKLQVEINGKFMRTQFDNAMFNRNNSSYFERQCEFHVVVDMPEREGVLKVVVDVEMDMSKQAINEYMNEKVCLLERECNQLEISLKNKEGHIEQLLESERKYVRESQSNKEKLSEMKQRICEKQERIEQLLQSHREMERIICDKEQYIEQLLESEKKYVIEVQNNKERLSELEQTIRNKEGHIEQLLEVEREYEREKNSRTYRMALRFRRISVAILPVNSKRRFFVKVLAKAIRHPLLTLKMMNPRRIKNCFTILKTEGVESAQNHYRLVEEYEKSRTVPVDNENLVIEKISEEAKNFEEYEKLRFSKFEEPLVSIVIPVYNQFDYTYHCLESILRNSGECTYEIIIANDCSTDLTQRIEELVEGITVINNETNLRFLLNCKNAAKQAKGKYILFLNNDTQVQENWLQPLVELIEKDSRIGMVGSKLIYSDGYLQEAGGILWKDASAWNYGNRQNPNDSEFSYVREVDYISGAAMMIHADLWKEIGGFDERFVPAYCEDSDLAFEVRKHGYKVVLQPKSVVVHFEGISNGTDLTAGQKKYQVDNQKKFYEKWKAELDANHFENGTNVFLARERSKEQKHVLVIDHYVPQYDKDAGSKTTFMYLKMLVQKGYKITFLGDNFYQHEPYTSELQQMGILVLYGPKYAEHWKEWLEENIQYFDVFYLNRPHISVKYIDFIKERARGKIIYYGHDLHFLRLKREYEISGEERLLKESDEWLEKELYLMRRADMNYYPSQVEVEEIHKIDASIPVKAITAYVYDEFQDISYDINDRQGLLFVGGFGHGPNVDAVLWFVEKIYPEVYKNTKAPFYIVGSKAPEEITNLKVEGVEVKGFVTEEELQELYRTSRIAVVPLRYGAGVKGKVVEALYYGIPIATTSVGAEGIKGVEDIAVVKDREAELIRSISNLYSDGARLKSMSWKSQKYIRENFGTEAVWSIIENDFN